jgi:hypothetical protein
MKLTSLTSFCPPCVLNLEDIWKNSTVPPRPLKEITNENSHSDAFVFFGAIGDLARRKVLPTLQAMVKRGHLDVPVIGVAKAIMEHEPR